MAQKVECAAILAGGKSRRMGRDKALLEIGHQTLVAHIASVLIPIFSRVCVVTNLPAVSEAAGLPAVFDSFEQRGPLGGIHAALSCFKSPTFVVACDMPFLNAAFIEFLSQNFEGDALVPRSEDGFEPLHAVYSSSLTPIFEDSLRKSDRQPSLRRILNSLDTRFVPLEIARFYDPTLKCFTNWNTPDDAQGIPE